MFDRFRSRQSPIRIVLSAALVAASVAVSAACAATRLERSWAAPSLHPDPFRHVVAIAMSADPQLRAVMEDALAGQLSHSSDGLEAHASYKVAGAIQNGDQFRDLLAAAGADGAILMRITDVRRDHVWVPGRPLVAPTYYRTIWDYYAHWQTLAFQPGYMAGDRSVRIETTMYSVPEGDLVYTAISDTLNPASPEDLVKLVGNRVARDLADRGLVGARR